MAKSLAHTWGQIVGEHIFEPAFQEILSETAAQAGVYLDYNGNKRLADCGVRNARQKLAWQDNNGNWHQLDFVFERGGTTAKVGIPLAFIEIAWRRYTKHSKNKAQEIEGAIIPLADTYRHSHPFLGAIIGGEFTGNSLQQLKSRGFSVIHVPYKSIIAAFAKVGIDASYDEDTEEDEYETKLEQFSRLSDSKKVQLRDAVVRSVDTQVGEFIKNLQASISRQVERILIVPLHGNVLVLDRIDKAIAFISTYAEAEGTTHGVLHYEIQVRFSNQAELKGIFPTKAEAVAFLRSL
jgi:hypothetical protein